MSYFGIPNLFKGKGLPSVLLALVLMGATPPSSHAESPFTFSRGPIVAGFSLKSWEEYWTLFQARNLGTIVFETVADDFLPSVLKLTDATGEVTNLPKILHEFASSTDWTLLQKSEIQGTIYRIEGGVPGVGAAMKIIPPDASGVGTLYQNLSGLCQAVAAHSQGALSWNPGSPESWLGIAALGEATSPACLEGKGILFLHQTGQSVILSTETLFNPNAPEQGVKEEIVNLWKQIPEPRICSVMVDLRELAAMLQLHAKVWTALMEAVASDSAASLIPDKTTEALFDKDPETLKKLRQVEQDFNQLVPPGSSGKIAKPIQEALSILEAQGVLLSGVGPTSGGILETTLWSVDASTPDGGLFEVSPLSPRMLSLLQSGIVEVSIQGLPDFQRIYTRILDLVRQLPGGDEILAQWDALQVSLGVSVEKDLLPAIGREMGWVSRKKEKGGFISGLTGSSNDLFYVLDLRDPQAADHILSKAGELLAQYGLPASATKVADVTFSVLNTGIMGKAMWGKLQDPPVLIVTTSDSKAQLEGLIQSIRNPQAQGLSQHPRWEQLRSLWNVNPTAVQLSDLTTAWKQTLDQMKSSQMMMALMGSSGSMSLPFIRMGIRVLQAMQPPEWGFTVESAEPGMRKSQTLLLYPLVEKEGTQP